MNLCGYYLSVGTSISRDCTYNFPINKELSDYAAAPQFARTFHVFYNFQLESGIVTSFSEHPQQQFPSLRGKTVGHTVEASSLVKR